MSSNRSYITTSTGLNNKFSYREGVGVIIYDLIYETPLF